MRRLILFLPLVCIPIVTFLLHEHAPAYAQFTPPGGGGSGATGPTGPTGATGPTGPAGTPAPPYLTISGTKYGPLFALTSPPSSGWTTVNGGSSTVTTVNNSVAFVWTPNLGLDQLRCYMRALPASTGYTASMGLLSVAHAVGFAISDGTKFIAVWQGGQGVITAFDFATSTSAGSAYFTDINNVGTYSSIFFGQFQDTGGNRIFSLSADGVNWQPINTQTSGTFLTETQFGTCYETNQLQRGAASLVHVVSSTP